MLDKVPVKAIAEGVKQLLISKLFSVSSNNGKDSVDSLPKMKKKKKKKKKKANRSEFTYKIKKKMF